MFGVGFSFSWLATLARKATRRVPAGLILQSSAGVNLQTSTGSNLLTS
jgi:hypothetical protein